TNTYTSAMLEVVSGSAEEWEDFYIPDIFVDFMDGETEKTILIEVSDYGYFEGTESFKLKLMDDPYNPEIVLGENASTTIDILDKETTYLEFASSNYVIMEQEYPLINPLEVTITRSGNTDSNITLMLEVVSGSAEESNDFYIPNIFVDFWHQETEKTVLIEVPNEGSLEGIENFKLKLIDDYYYPEIVLGKNASTSIDILDKETTYLEFASSNYVTMEQENSLMNPLEVTVTRSGNTDSYTTAMLEVVSGSAEEWEDFYIPNIFVDFMDGETEKTVLIEVPDDGSLEETESFKLKLIDDPYNPEIALGENSNTRIDILDKQTSYVEFASSNYVIMEQEDSFMNLLEVTVTRSGNTDSYTTAMLEVVSGSAEHWRDFYVWDTFVNFMDGETEKTILIEVPDDGFLEGTESFKLKLIDEPYNPNIALGKKSSTSIDILDKQTTYLEFASSNYVIMEQEDPIMNPLEVTVTRSGNTNTYTSAMLEVVSGSAEEWEDFYIPDIFVDFMDGETEKTILIEVPNDGYFEGTESFKLKLMDDPYNPEIVLGENASTTIDILDKQTTYLEFASSKYVTMEQEDPIMNPLEVTVTRSGNTDSYTTAMLEVVSGSAEESSDFYIPNIPIDFMYGETEKTILIEVPNDGFLEGTESFELKLIDDPYNPEITLGENASTTIDIIDKQAIFHDPITGMIDQHIGTYDPDIFVLGDENEAFYDTNGQLDYAEIWEFDMSQDTIQLHGIVEDYYIGSSSSGSNDQPIFLQVAGMEHELIGVVKETTNLDLNSNNFVFV
ncbi:MAG: Calx-beta domain-containing protein, partial [Crocosphaera sp.]